MNNICKKYTFGQALVPSGLRKPRALFLLFNPGAIRQPYSALATLHMEPKYNKKKEALFFCHRQKMRECAGKNAGLPPRLW